MMATIFVNRRKYGNIQADGLSEYQLLKASQDRVGTTTAIIQVVIPAEKTCLIIPPSF
jgi:hypothetical protein